MDKLHTSVILFLIFFSLGEYALAQDSNALIINSLAANKFDTNTVEWKITSQHTSTASKVHHIYYEQIVDGIPVRGTQSSLHVSGAGSLLSENNRFVKDISELKKIQNTP